MYACLLYMLHHRPNDDLRAIRDCININFNGLIKKTIPAADYLVDIKDFYKKINDFDANAVRAAAKTCSMG